MRRIAIGATTIALFTAPSGCLGSESETCDWGEVCPPDYTCHATTESCVLPAQIVACDGLDNMDVCYFPGAPSDTLCISGICVAPRCGNGVLDTQLGEVCDDGPANSDTEPDACRTDCQLPYCGDGVEDTGECNGSCEQDCRPRCPPSPDGQLICISGYARYFQDPSDPTRIMETVMTSAATTLEVRIYDPLAYAANPNTPPLAVGQVDPQTGWYLITDINVPATNFVVTVVEDWDGSAADDYAFAGALVEAVPGVNIDNAPALGITYAQDAAWSSTVTGPALVSAGCAGGTSLLECGTWIGVYAIPSGSTWSGIAGVTPQNGGGSPPPAIPIERSFYLDTDYTTFLNPTTMGISYTTDTGIVFVPAATLGNYAGGCAAGSTCESAG